MEFELPEGLQMMKAQVRRFVDSEVIPIEREASDGFDMLPHYRRDLETKTKDLGYWFVELPEALGGLDLGLTARVLLWEEMGRTIAVPPRKQSIFGPEISPILLNLSEAQKEDYLYPVIRGEKTTCFALSEPDAGGDPGAIRTTAVRDGDDWVINGYKIYITGAQSASFAQVMAVTDPAKGRRGGISSFLVDMDTPGLTIAREQGTMMGDRPCELSFDNVRVPGSALIGAEGRGFEFAQDWINQGRIRHGARAIGVIERCLEMAVSHATQRKTFGQKLADRQAVQWMLVELLPGPQGAAPDGLYHRRRLRPRRGRAPRRVHREDARRPHVLRGGRPLHADPRRSGRHRRPANREVLARPTQHDDHRGPRGDPPRHARPEDPARLRAMSAVLAPPRGDTSRPRGPRPRGGPVVTMSRTKGTAR